MSPSLVYTIVGYVAGFLVFPFFWSFMDGWPFAKPRLDGDDTLFSLLMCVFWPIVFLAVLISGWWCVMSGLGAWSRNTCDRIWKEFVRWARES